jgi:hypothetical protein
MALLLNRKLGSDQYSHHKQMDNGSVAISNVSVFSSFPSVSLPRLDV